MTKLRAKVVLEGELEVLTGLHVGSAAAGMQIGSVDSPVVRDPMTS
jgi:CRISPR-associated protein Csm3